MKPLSRIRRFVIPGATVEKPTKAASDRSWHPVRARFSTSIVGWTVVLFVMLAPSQVGADKSKKRKNQAGAFSEKWSGRLPITELTEDEAIRHALDRLGYGPRPGDVERVRKLGLESWIDQQLEPDSLDDSALTTRLKKYPTLEMSSKQLLDSYPRTRQDAKVQTETKKESENTLREKRREPMRAGLAIGGENLDRAQLKTETVQGPRRIVTELSMARMDRAVYSQRQLEAVMEDFWLNHFNVYAQKGANRWLVTSYVRDTIRPNAMGRFNDLLLATAKSPAMLFFLDNWQSVDSTAYQQWQQRPALRGSWRTFSQSRLAFSPRSIGNRLQKRGLNENYGREVMELHTVGVEARYTERDVIEMAKCLTGWTIREPRHDPQYVFRPEFHAQGDKLVMGHTLHYGGERDGEEALEFLATSPATALSLAKELARHFASDNPPQSLIDRMAQSYETTGGDIRVVLRTMVYSQEFWSRQSYRAKVKTPFELVASAARALDAEVAFTLSLTQWVGRMGEPLFLRESPRGYPDQAAAWVNTGALLNRLNFAAGLAANRIAGVAVDLATTLGNTSQDPERILSRAFDSLLYGEVSQGTRDAIELRLKDPAVVGLKGEESFGHVDEGLLAGWVLGSPEFQRR